MKVSRRDLRALEGERLGHRAPPSLGPIVTFALLAALVALAGARLAHGHESPTIALRLDVEANGAVFVQQIAGPRALVALELPGGCHLARGRAPGRLETSQDLPARVQCTHDGVRGAWRVSGLGAHAQALAVRAEGTVHGTWTVLAADASFTLVDDDAALATAHEGVGALRDRFDPRPALVAGAAHVARGLDHLALVALLVVRAKRPRDALVPLLGFTLAHALTLALAAFGHPLMPGRLAELLVACSLVLATTLEPAEPRGRRTATAFVFGLVHGVAFLEGAAPLLLHGRDPLATLAAFHVGIELVQGAIAVAMAVALTAAEARESFALRLRTHLATAAGAYGIALVLARLA